MKPIQDKYKIVIKNHHLNRVYSISYKIYQDKEKKKLLTLVFSGI